TARRQRIAVFVNIDASSLIPQLHREADELVPLLFKNCRGGGRIHATTHCYRDLHNIVDCQLPIANLILLYALPSIENRQLAIGNVKMPANGRKRNPGLSSRERTLLFGCRPRGRALRSRSLRATSSDSQGPDRLREDTVRRAYGVAAGATIDHRCLS